LEIGKKWMGKGGTAVMVAPLFLNPLSHKTGKKVVIEITFPTKGLSIPCIFCKITIS
jgi:hypothetical protein